jgi:hypothetical protein
MPDADLAEQLGRSIEAVRTRRVSRGILRFGGKRHMAWTDEADALFGTAADRVVALRLGCDWQQVRHRRKKLGIPPHRRRVK